MARYAVSAVDISTIVPLPISVADNKASAFTPLAGEAPLARVVRTMLGDPTRSRVVVAAADALVRDVRESLAIQGLSSVAVVATGSGTRAECLGVGLEYLAGESIPSPRVLIADIRRPLAPVSLRDRVGAGLHAGSSVVLPVLPVTDSVKAVDECGSVIGTLDRSTLQNAQYPRGFSVDQLSQLLGGGSTVEFDELDEAIRAGVPITVVDGDPDAFVVELPRDAAYVEAIIACRRGVPHRADPPGDARRPPHRGHR